MTKKEAKKEFESRYACSACHTIHLGSDKVALREGWNNYTDFLCKEGRITQKQYDTWDNPY